MKTAKDNGKATIPDVPILTPGGDLLGLTTQEVEVLWQLVTQGSGPFQVASVIVGLQSKIGAIRNETVP